MSNCFEIRMPMNCMPRVQLRSREGSARQLARLCAVTRAGGNLKQYSKSRRDKKKRKSNGAETRMSPITGPQKRAQRWRMQCRSSGARTTHKGSHSEGLKVVRRRGLRTSSVARHRGLLQGRRTRGAGEEGGGGEAAVKKA